MSQALHALQAGDLLPASPWQIVTQSMINQFAQATGDHQWIHLDAERCAKESPFQVPIAHGFLTVSLLPAALDMVMEPDAKILSMINYGVESVRFLEAVRVNDEVAFEFTLDSVTDKGKGRLLTFSTRCLIKNREKPAMVGQLLLMLILKPE